jgi:hypothetical protein
MSAVTITPVSTKAERAQWVDYVYAANAGDPSFVPQLRSEEMKKVTPGGNPFHEHARCQLFLAREGGRIVGRISAHIDELALGMPAEQGMGPGTGNWGALEAETQEIASQLIATAEGWLREQGMSRVLAPMSLSIWEEPGLLIKGHDHPPTVMMGHQNAKFQPWVEAAGYTPAKLLNTYELDITKPFPPLIQRIISSGMKNPRIKIRGVDLKKFDEEAALILDILNDAWSDNWGFVPITDSEVEYTGKNLKPLIQPDLVQVAEYDGVPVAFMMTLPDMNEVLAKIGPKPSPLGWIRLLLWIWKPRVRTMRVPLMGVRKSLQSSRMASQLAFMMIEQIRVNSVTKYGATRGEIGWILDDNQGMNSIAREIHSTVNKEYMVYEKAL